VTVGDQLAKRGWTAKNEGLLSSLWCEGRGVQTITTSGKGRLQRIPKANNGEKDRRLKKITSQSRPSQKKNKGEKLKRTQGGGGGRVGSHSGGIGGENGFDLRL